MSMMNRNENLFKRKRNNKQYLRNINFTDWTANYRHHSTRHTKINQTKANVKCSTKHINLFLLHFNILFCMEQCKINLL